MENELPGAFTLSAEPRIYRRLLLAWYDQNKRSMPWRRLRSLYGTWISEMMLQQTTVKVVAPHWEKFMAVFPDVEALAAADVEEVLSQWTGLGYYRRARQLHEAAGVIVNHLGGEFPTDQEGWLALPGIGPYASGAIASIGLGRRVAAVDANARRVFSRWLVGDPEFQPDLKPVHLQRVAQDLVDEERPGDWNEAVMELGATVCGPAEPLCSSCPVNTLCRARMAGIVKLVPPPKKAALTLGVELGLLVVLWKDKVLLVPPGCGHAVIPQGSPAPVREDVSGLHKGLWGLPSTPWLPPPAKGHPGWPGEIWRPWLRAVPLLNYSPKIGDPTRLGGFRHAITRYRLNVQIYGLRLAEDLPLGKKILAQSADIRPLMAGFWGIPSPNHPISNLVTKSLSLAAHSNV